MLAALCNKDSTVEEKNCDGKATEAESCSRPLAEKRPGIIRTQGDRKRMGPNYRQGRNEPDDVEIIVSPVHQI